MPGINSLSSEESTTGLVRFLMQEYKMSSAEVMEMLQSGGLIPEIRPNTQGEPRPERYLENQIGGPELESSRIRQMPESELDLPKFNQGGRIGFQTGGTTVSQQLQPDWIEALGKTYAADLTRQAGIPAITQATAQMPGETASQFAQRQAQAQQFDITQQSMGALAPQVAAQDPMQTAAYAQATDPTYGLGAYQPYAADARTAAQAATALTGTGAGTGAGSIASYMSPYHQDVIDTSLTEFDELALREKATQAATALGTTGAFGG